MSLGCARLSVPDSAARDELADFVARVVRLEPSAVVRLCATPGQVNAWAPTPFEVLTTHRVPGELTPADLTVPGHELLAALAVQRGASVDPGGASGARWLAELPSRWADERSWSPVAEVADAELDQLAGKAIELAHGQAGSHGTPPDSLLDRALLTVSGAGLRVPVPLRCLLALSGMGLLGGRLAGEKVQVRATDSWLRLDTRHGSVVRRRRALLPLVSV
jgi:hypothetical protein